MSVVSLIYGAGGGTAMLALKNTAKINHILAKYDVSKKRAQISLQTLTKTGRSLISRANCQG